MLFDLSTFFLCFLSMYFFFSFDNPSLLLQENQKRNLFELCIIFFWWMDDMFCVTPRVEVSLYMWVYVISIMKA
jgi:hypothetical protein